MSLPNDPFWREIVRRHEATPQELARHEEELATTPGEPIDSTWIRQQVKAAVGRTASTPARRRRRRAAMATVALLLTVPSLAWGSRKVLWPSHRNSAQEMSVDEMMGLLDATPTDRASVRSAWSNLCERTLYCMRTLGQVAADNSDAACGDAAAQLPTILAALRPESEPPAIRVQDDWIAIGSLAANGAASLPDRRDAIAKLGLYAAQSAHRLAQVAASSQLQLKTTNQLEAELRAAAGWQR